MQPSEYDIRREVEALRDIRRRSTTPGALALDPDLPNQGPPTSPTSPYRPQDASTSALPHSDPAPSPTSGADDPFHLFWVPASLHPEIAPAEFRAFLKEHARNPPSDDDRNALQRSSSSTSTVSSGLGRKKSMLSRQYQPSDNDSSDDRLRNILRRSLSLNVSPLDDAADFGDEADQPIVVAPPGQFLRRAARTKIRKPGLPGDGGGHRFGASRRGPSGRSTTSPVLQRTSSDVSSSDHGESVESFTARPRTFSDEGPHDRPDSFSEEALIYDAYARDDDDEMPLVDEPQQLELSPPQQDVPPLPPHSEPALLEAPGPVIHQPQPTRLLSPSSSDPYQSQQSGGKKERERLEKERREKEQREKDSGFFGSLFGKKKHDAQASETPSLHGGREAAQALLGQSRTAKSPGPPSPMGMAPGMMGSAAGINNYSRYPIHVERAIYRLSHIKLANPRRPLYEQVLISNLMFWYLGASAAGAGANGQAGAQPGEGETEKMERERAEREAAAAASAAQERAEKERMERERAVPPGGQRRAETPVKGPQYEMQHRVMEKEYGGFNGNGPVRPNTAPGPNVGPAQVYQRPQQSPISPKSNPPSGPQGKEHFYYSPGETMQQQPRLPPGAMPPVDQSTRAASPSRSPPPPNKNHNMQPMPIYNPDGGAGGARLGGRSLSATAVPSPPQPVTNGKIRKGTSAYAGVPANGRRPWTATGDRQQRR
ncbi:hypothetical protein B0H10DRAFT_2163198 [Mycena sp. CBHHK59/15]|nr:hypothetical protein B0H10DRAFT_2163198 [Mycena sp. CBHHK59/15]